MKIKLSLCVLLLLLSPGVFAETVYVDDQIKIWSRTGPTNGYRVKNELAPGAKLEVLQKNEESGFVEVRDESGRTGWVDGKFLTSSPTAHQQLAIALNEIKQLKSQHLSRVTTLEKRLQDLEPLETFNKELQSRLATQETELETLRQKSQMYKDGFNGDVFYYGAVVVLSGMFLGWLLSKVGGRRRDSGWR